MVTLDQAGAGIPAVSLLSAPRGLRDRVALLWTERPMEARHPERKAWRIVPDDSSHLLYHRFAPRSGAAKRHRLVVAGPRTRFVDVDKSRRSFTVGVRFRPWSAASLLGISAVDLVDRSVGLETLLGAEGRAIERRLGACGEEEAPAVLVGWLLRRARAETPDERRARRAAIRLRRGDGCEGAASTAGVGGRWLRAVMRDQVGLSPKALARVARLHRALHRIRDAREVPGSRIAVASGYYDQSHMIREFRRLLGETPGRWRARGG